MVHMAKLSLSMYFFAVKVFSFSQVFSDEKRYFFMKHGGFSNEKWCFSNEKWCFSYKNGVFFLKNCIFSQ